MYKSLAQQRFFHSPEATKAGITEKQVKEYDKATKGRFGKLKEYVKKKKEK